MEYRRLGNSGLQVSALSFGSWVTFHNQVDLSRGERLMAMAYEKGVNFFDNAEVYANGESEIIMGKALAKVPWPRDSYCVSSKVFWGGEKPTQKGLSRKHIFDAAHAALKRLQVDYLDLYFCHRSDPDTPIEETVRSMNDLIRQGKILYWGTSEWSAEDLKQAYTIAKEHHLIGPTMEQPQYNLFHRERVEQEYKDLYRDWGMGTTIWSPLASGILTGKYNKGIPSECRANVPGYAWLKEQILSDTGKEKVSKAQKLENIAKEIGVSLSQLSIAWCLKNPHVSTVILGASKEEQLAENLNSIEVLDVLTKEVMQQIHHVVENI